MPASNGEDMLCFEIGMLMTVNRYAMRGYYRETFGCLSWYLMQKAEADGRAT